MNINKKENLRTLPALHSQSENPDPVASARFFDSLSFWCWYAIEFDGNDTFFGLVCGFESELGQFHLSEFAEINRDSGFDRIKLDDKFVPTPINKISKALKIDQIITD